MLRLSSKQKQNIYSLSGLLLHVIIFVALLISLNSCNLITADEKVAPPGCTTYATIKDMRGLDGCGFILVLDDGQRLQPVYWWDTTTSGQQKEFDLSDGKRVRIGYEEALQATTCMMGKTVRLTCMSEVGTSQPRVQ